MDRLGVVYKTVKYSFAVVVDDRNTAEDLTDVGTHHLAVNSNLFGEKVQVRLCFLSGFRLRHCIYLVP